MSRLAAALEEACRCTARIAEWFQAAEHEARALFVGLGEEDTACASAAANGDTEYVLASWTELSRQKWLKQGMSKLKQLAVLDA